MTTENIENTKSTENITEIEAAPKNSLLSRYQAGDRRALARALTLAESALPAALPVLRAAHASSHRASSHRAKILGITGSPGSGKSTLSDQLITHLREQGERVAVLAVDPSSPYSGGAILGDRVRMLRHHADAGVFVRSLASRGALGGLSARTIQVLTLMEGFHFDWVILETVGVGQSEVDIAAICDHTLLVLTPAGGDGIQAFKAGIMEIADILAVNKADLPGADRTVRELRAAQGLAPHDEHTWMAPIVRMQAHKGEGIEELLQAVLDHRTHLGETGLQQRRERRAEFELYHAVQEQVFGRLRELGSEVYGQIASGECDVADVVERMLSSRC